MTFDPEPIDPSDPAQREGVEQWTEVRALAELDAVGEYATPFSVEEVVAFAAEPGVDRCYWGLRREGRVVGSLVVVLPQLDDQPVGHLGVHVAPGHRRRGIGSALLAFGEERARAAGRTQVSVQSHFLPATRDPSAGFLGRRGYAPALTHVQRDLALGGVVHEPAPVAEDYEVETVEGMPPEAWLPDLALLMARMSTDAPQGDLDLREEVWDAARYAASVRTQLASDRRVLTAVARERATGRLVAFTVAVVPAQRPHLAIQHETLVLREHRGHGLGRSVKEALVALLRRSAPGVVLVRTWNAEGNAPMVAVNDALGFVPVAGETEWQKRL